MSLAYTHLSFMKSQNQEECCERFVDGRAWNDWNRCAVRRAGGQLYLLHVECLRQTPANRSHFLWCKNNSFKTDFEHSPEHILQEPGLLSIGGPSDLCWCLNLTSCGTPSYPWTKNSPALGEKEHTGSTIESFECIFFPVLKECNLRYELWLTSLTGLWIYANQHSLSKSSANGVTSHT